MIQLFVLLFLGLAGCARLDSAAAPHPVTSSSLPASLYAALPRGKSPGVVPEFFLIDGFNTREKKNRLGFPWKAEGARPGSFRAKQFRQDSLQGKRGGSLRFKASLRPQETVAFKSSLEILDMSQAQALVLNCRPGTKPETASSGKFELRLQDWQGKAATADLVPCLSTASWKEVILPRSLFSAVDWNQLKEIAFLLSAAGGPLRTEVVIDEVSFYGPKDVRFRSQRDNLKGFPRQKEARERTLQLLGERSSERFLYEIAKDTWKYFENALDAETRLPVDHLRVSEPGDVGAYTTPTNLAMYFLACVAARELGFISKKEAVGRIKKTIQTLERMKTWQGFYYNFYETRTLQVTRDYVSTVDSGWLAAAWVVLRQAFPQELGAVAARFLEATDFYEFYDPSIGQLRLGFDGSLGDFSPYHYGILGTEARVTSFVGIGKGDLPREHWWFVYRTPPKSWDWQSQVPEGVEKEMEGTTLFQGYYTYQKKKFVPSWGGSLFEFLMPALVIKEKELAPEGLGLNNRVATAVHIDYALNRQGYPIWGLSPASTSTGRQWRYGEYGVKYLGVKGYRDEGIVAPYVTFLALDTLPEQAIDNLRRMLELYNVYGEYGFYDSINVRNGMVNAQYLALDQGMALIALANYLRQGAIKEYFHRDEVAQKAESLLSQEQFFPDQS